jgi:hypothetical protein
MSPHALPRSRIIVDCEVNSGAWTLMHRFNKAAELLGDAVSGRFKQGQSQDESLARIYVWLRYSAIRQLTWQRNYNTQVCARGYPLGWLGERSQSQQLWDGECWWVLCQVFTQAVVSPCPLQRLSCGA